MKIFTNKKELLSVFMLFVCGALAFSQAEQGAKEFQKELNAFYKNPKESPLKSKAKKFKGHKFFPIDDKFKVRAKFLRTLKALPFQMKTTTSRLPVYEAYGQATFVIDGQELTLTLYQGHETRLKEEFRDYLFLPFTDVTNGEETYQGGRFIDMKLPEGDLVIIDFNKAYNPYCAYSADYSCPIPPEENDLDIRVTAGVKYSKNKKH